MQDEHLSKRSWIAPPGDERETDALKNGVRVRVSFGFWDLDHHLAPDDAHDYVFAEDTLILLQVGEKHLSILVDVSTQTVSIEVD
jgi:hypothetical protein